ncbi:hypothetical protein MAR_010861 [Mya arenaria]|uniref:Uncharacterized protein n=1 Tax=Mya arenaria TaxID=6604 RepID=A0ABY7FU60_MYAAR|nr:hypothetical protein MAR_010861 [Mya arenaria]
MGAFKESHMEDYIDLFRDFEIKKRDISTKKSGGKINLRMPLALVETVKEVTGKTIKETILGSAYGERIKHHGDKIRVDADIVIELRARVGEKVKLSQEGQESTTTPVFASQNTIGFEIYASLNPNPTHTTEKECSKIGYLEIPIDDTSLGKDREFGVRFIFGGTEIEVKVEDKADKRVFRKRVDFLG